jgi:hypothetical protein
MLVKLLKDQMLSNPDKVKQTCAIEKFIAPPELFFLAIVIFVTI